MKNYNFIVLILSNDQYLTNQWSCIINVERKKDTDQFYLTFKRIKIRYRDPNDLGYFNHPFVIGNRMMLIDDFNLE